MRPSISTTPLIGLLAPPAVMLIIWLTTDLAWLGLLLELVAIVAGVVTFRWLKRNPAWFAGGEARSVEITDVEIPSAEPGTNFRFSAVARWQGQPADSVAAQGSILRQAGEVSAGWRPDQIELAHHALADGLGLVRFDGRWPAVVSVANVRLTLSESDHRHLELKNSVLRETELWELKIAMERKVRTYLRDEALRTPESTIIWWLSRNESGVEQAVELADVLTRLSDLAAGRATPAVDEPLGARLSEALERVEPPGRRHKAEQVAAILEEIGCGKDAGVVRRTFNVEKLVDVRQNGHSKPTAEVIDR